MSVPKEDIRRAIEGLLQTRQPPATICPSEAARSLSPKDWRPLMPEVRAVAIAMAKDGLLQISQAGRSVDLDQPLRGPIRLGHLDVLRAGALVNPN